MQPSECARCLLLAVLALPLKSPADPPADVTYTYDELGRLRTGTFNDGRKVDYQYDAAGNRTTVTMGTPPQLSVAAAPTVTEGSNLVFSVTKTGTSAQNITVDCVPTDGSASSTGAAPFDDYTRVTQQITFLPTDPSPHSRPCTIVTKADSWFEGGETVNVALQNASPGSTITSGSVAGTISDDDAAPVFSVSNDSKTEGTALAFTVSKSGLTQLSHGVKLLAYRMDRLHLPVRFALWS